MKLDNKTKKMIRKVADCLPIYYERFHQRKHIHSKEIEMLDIIPENYQKDKQYQASFYDGKRLVDSKLHYKRLCNAWKKGGSEEYRKYLKEFSQKSFKSLTLWGKFLMKMNWN